MIDVNKYTKLLEALLDARGVRKLEAPLLRSSPNNDRIYSSMEATQKVEEKFYECFWLGAAAYILGELLKSPSPCYFRASVFYTEDGTSIVAQTQTDDEPPWAMK
jgi:hypothetical protein